MARIDRWTFIAFAVVILLMAVYLPFPLKGDQAMFLYGARALSEGARLYSEFWDMKQPGIYWFYRVAGELFGFDQVGLHMLELVWFVALAIVLTAWLAPALRHHALIAWISLYSAGVAYGTTYWESVYGGQVEFLVALPIAATLYLLSKPAESVSQRTSFVALAGACTAVVAIFKLILVIIPAALIVLIVLRAILFRKASVRRVFLEQLIPIGVGFFVVLALVIAYLWVQGSLGDAYWANFVYPTLALEAFPHAPPWRMRASIETFLGAMWPLIPLVILGVLDGVRRRSFHVLALVVWIGAAAGAVLIQLLSWWLYHFALFVVPFGLLALLGIDACLVWLSGRSMSAFASSMAVTLLCAVPIAICVLLPTLRQLDRVWLSGAPPWSSLQSFASRADPTVNALREGATFLDAPNAAAGPIGVLGDPRVIWVTDRRPVLQINGWTYFLPGQLAAEAAALRQTRPPYVYVSSYLEHLHTNGTPVLYQTLNELYRQRSTDTARGTWYVRRDLIEPKQ